LDTLNQLLFGLSIAITPINLLYCFIGVLIGTLVGVLPGLGPIATISMLLPITFTLPADTSLIMLAGIYYGAQYGGSTTSILINIPGEASSVVTALDGHAMARAGRAGVALGIAAIASFIAGCVATLVIAFFAPILSNVALSFRPADYFSLMVFGLVAAVVLASGSVLKALGAIVLGLLLGLVGSDVNSGALRFTGGVPDLMNGIEFVVVAMGLFGLAETICNVQRKTSQDVITTRIDRLLPNVSEMRMSLPAIGRGTVIGSVLGLLPGGGALLASFAAYSIEKKVASKPRNFGSGDIRGVASPEAANNGGAQTSFIPLLTLGVPSNPTMALVLGALLIQGITPGPQVMTERPALFWGLIASMWIGNLMLVILNIPLIGLWVRLVKVPYHFLFPSILVFCCVGAYTINNNVFDIYVMAAAGVLGYALVLLRCEPAPLVLGFILGPLMEENMRRALLISKGDAAVFLTQPISLAFLLASVAVVSLLSFSWFRQTRETALADP
jgi:putative tricarboxylic transport membrane protein